ncbi:MAG: AAA family ATPase, partial [Methanomicrobiales archaeon HGW-Methanomicrobiales-4]
MRRKIPYGIMNYAEMIQENRYFIDKTSYIEKLNDIKNPVFLRPRRFGKSLFCSMLQYYYDLQEANRFDDLFGNTWIGKNPTPD